MDLIFDAGVGIIVANEITIGKDGVFGELTMLSLNNMISCLETI